MVSATVLPEALEHRRRLLRLDAAIRKLANLLEPLLELLERSAQKGGSQLGMMVDLLVSGLGEWRWPAAQNNAAFAYPIASARHPA